MLITIYYPTTFGDPTLIPPHVPFNDPLPQRPSRSSPHLEPTMLVEDYERSNNEGRDIFIRADLD